MTAGRDGIDALEDILENMALATSVLGDLATVHELEDDPKSLYSVARALEAVGQAAKRVPATCVGDRVNRPGFTGKWWKPWGMDPTLPERSRPHEERRSPHGERSVAGKV